MEDPAPDRRSPGKSTKAASSKRSKKAASAKRAAKKTAASKRTKKAASSKPTTKATSTELAIRTNSSASANALAIVVASSSTNYQLRLPGGKCIKIDPHDMAFDALSTKMDKLHSQPCHPRDTLEVVPMEFENQKSSWCRTAIYRHHPLMVDILGFDDEDGVDCAPMEQLGTWIDELHELRPLVTSNEFTRAMTAAIATPRSDIFRNLPRVTADVAFPKVRREITNTAGQKGRHKTQLVRVVPVYLLPFLCVFYDGSDLLEFTASIDALGAQMLGAANNTWRWRTYAQYLANAASARNLNSAHVAGQVSLARTEASVCNKTLSDQMAALAADMVSLREEVEGLRANQTHTQQDRGPGPGARASASAGASSTPTTNSRLGVGLGIGASVRGTLARPKSTTTASASASDQPKFDPCAHLAKVKLATALQAKRDKHEKRATSQQKESTRKTKRHKPNVS